jgi:phosphatidate cytidylyltransferase
MLITRILTAALLLAVFLPALFWLPKLYWALLMALVAAVAAWEWGGLAGLQARGRLAFGGIMLVGCAASHYVISRPSEFNDAQFFTGALFVSAVLFWVLVLPFWLWRRWRPGKIVLLCLGFVLIYVTWFAFILWRSTFSPWTLLAVMGIAWVADISAYFTGRKFGGKKLAPNISPGKTWAGVWGALAGVAVYGAILLRPGVLWGVSLVDQATVVILLWMFAFLALTVIGIMGDLLESLLKRQAGVKDSSAILPGHGGVLDRIDSLMAILPCAICFFILFSALDFYSPVFCCAR